MRTIMNTLRKFFLDYLTALRTGLRGILGVHSTIIVSVAGNNNFPQTEHLHHISCFSEG